MCYFSFIGQLALAIAMGVAFALFLGAALYLILSVDQEIGGGE